MHNSGWFTYMRGASSESQKSRVTLPLIKRVFTYAKPYHMDIALLLFTILLTTGLGLITPLIFRDLIDNTLQNGDTQRLNILAIGLVLIPIISGGIRIIQRRLNAKIGEGVIYDLRVALYDHLQKMSLRFFTHTKTGELMSRLNSDVVDAQRAISNTIVEIITNIITVVATLAVMLTLEWKLTILGVLVLPAFIISARRIGKTLRDLAREQMQYNAQMNAMMNETLNISGTLLVKLFGRRTMEVNRFENRAVKVRDAGTKRAVIQTQFFVVISLVSAMGIAIVYWVGGHMVINGTFTIGTIVAFGTYLTQLYGPMQALTNAPVDFATSVVSFERVFEIIDLPLEIAEIKNPIKLDNVKGHLTFENVTFHYEIDDKHLLTEVRRFNSDDVSAVLSGQENGLSSGVGQSQARDTALKNLSFNIEPGQLIALVGPSGAGKTTTTYLIPRLYDPTEGRILIDGHDLRDVTLESLALQIGMVTQETYLFHDTVRTNLQYAKLDATQEELEAACKAANIHGFIMELSDGYDTIVGERGYRLSGGEKQRLALARVILKNPRILVLDEATSSLDSHSEALIQEALELVMKDRTSIVIAHRLSTILSADVILVMDRGEIAERGTHEELLKLGGIYAGLYETQFKSQQHETV